ncbi:ankyrin repeat domain-containing protein 13C-B-like isoform X2 [Argonauta hians]
MAEEEYLLHASVFKNDFARVMELLKTHDITQRDKHGNTPLHLAVILGHKECIKLLLDHGSPIRIKNSLGWTPLAEAVSYGNRKTIKTLLQSLKQQSRNSLEEKWAVHIEALRNLGDFYLELHWDFHSWVPLVSRILPSDICQIRKKGAHIRLDTTLVDFNGMNWERGDITFLFNGNQHLSKNLLVMDNKAKSYQWMRNEENDNDLEDEVDLLMSNDIVATQMSTKNITFHRMKSGWLFKEDKTELVGTFTADYYNIGGLILESRKRREHLTLEDLQRNKALQENFCKGAMMEDIGQTKQHERRCSLAPPSKPCVKWEDYIDSFPGSFPCLGRTPISKENCKTYKATVAMSEDFPMAVEELLDVLEVIAPFKQFQKLREFMTTKLPNGFPVKLELPVFPTVTATVTFTKFEWLDELHDSLFVIPNNYHEDSHRFPDL